MLLFSKVKCEHFLLVHHLVRPQHTVSVGKHLLKHWHSLSMLSLLGQEACEVVAAFEHIRMFFSELPDPKLDRL